MRALFLLLASLALLPVTLPAQNTALAEKIAAISQVEHSKISLKTLRIQRKVALKHYEKLQTMLVEVELQQKLDPSAEQAKKVEIMKAALGDTILGLHDYAELVAKVKVQHREHTQASKSPAKPQS